MTERRLIRALVVYNDLFYFLEGPRQRGMTYDYLKQLERYLTNRLKDGALPVQVLCRLGNQCRWRLDQASVQRIAPAAKAVDHHWIG